MIQRQQLKAQLTCAHAKNWEKNSFVTFCQVDVCKQGALLHIYKQHFPKTCHEEVLHPLPSPPGGCGTKCAICQPAEAKRPIIWTSFASLLCLHPHTGSGTSPGTRPARMCVVCRLGGWTSAQCLDAFRARGNMFWDEAMGKSLVSQHLEDTAGEIN